MICGCNLGRDILVSDVSATANKAALHCIFSNVKDHNSIAIMAYGLRFKTLLLDTYN